MAEVVSTKYQFVDEDVTKLKFERQVSSFKSHEEHYRNGGIICSRIEYPFFEFIFLSNHTFLNFLDSRTHQNILIQRPVPSLLFAIKIDYSNYDLLAPSIAIIDPISSKQSDKVAFFPYISPSQQDKKALPDDRFKSINQNILLKDNEDKLFICLRGIREYHEHPQHNGDSWFLYRMDGKGTILNILDRLQLYSVVNANQLFSQQQKLSI